MRVLLRRWGITVQDLGYGDPCGRVAVFGLRCEREQGKLRHVRYYDRPVLLRVKDAAGGRRYAVLGALDETHGTLDLAAGAESVPVAGLEADWSGDYTVVWQPPPTGASVIGPGAAGESVRWLRRRLAETPGVDLVDNGSGQFDAALGDALRAFQASRGLVPDGIAGPRTLVQLDNAVAASGVPHLMTPPLAAAAAAQSARAGRHPVRATRRPMSYILEALKKSQAERELGRVPTLDGVGLFAEDKLEPPRSPWALVSVGLAVTAVLIALYAALRQPPSQVTAPPAGLPADPVAMTSLPKEAVAAITGQLPASAPAVGRRSSTRATVPIKPPLRPRRPQCRRVAARRHHGPRGHGGAVGRGAAAQGRGAPAAAGRWSYRA